MKLRIFIEMIIMSNFFLEDNEFFIFYNLADKKYCSMMQIAISISRVRPVYEI